MKLQAPTKSRQRGAVLLTLFLVVFAVAVIRLMLGGGVL